MRIIKPGVHAEHGDVIEVRNAEYEVAERMTFNHALSKNELRRLNNYLNIKWGIAPVSRLERFELWVWKWLQRIGLR
jgi:hypothetical protein